MTAAYFGLGGYGGGSASVLHADSANPDHILVPDAQFLFTAHFHRAGPDLVLIGGDGHKLVIPEYFASEHHPALTAPNGASLSAHLVDLLAGSAAPNEYAQAGSITPPEPIGRCEKIVGTVTVIRNGVAVALNVGDAVYKSDVVQTAANSSAGVAFPDGSALNLVANTRMALNEYSYDPNSTSNSALFDLVEGGLSFVAGKVAHTGDMKIGTPIATMGIRGTAGWLYEDQVATVTAQAGNVTLHFAAVFDGVTNTQSTYSLYAVDANGQPLHDPNGNLIKLADVSSLQNGLVTTLTGQGINALPQVNVAPPDLTQQQFQNIVVPQVINMAIQAIQQYQNQQNQQNNQTNPNSNPTSGSSSPPPPPPPADNNLPIEHINLNTGPTVTITAVVNTPTGSSLPPPLQQQQQTTTTTTPSTTPQTFSWSPPSGSGPQPFNNAPDWQPPTSSPTPVPGPTDNVVDNSPTAMLVSDSETVNQLTVGTGAVVHVVGLTAPGSLTVTGTSSVSGTVTSDSTTDDPTITFEQAVTIGSGGTIEAIAADGRAAEIIFEDGVTIAVGGEVEATGTGASVIVFAGTVDDSGTILATDGGEITIGVPLTVESGAAVEATGSGSSVVTSNTVTLAGGTVEALNGASVTFDGGVTIAAGATVEASGSGASVFITNVNGPEVVDAGVIEAADGGKVTIFDVQVENESGTIEAMGADSMDLTTVTLSGSDIVGGKLETGGTGSSIFGAIEVGAGLEATFFDGSTSAGAVTIDAFVEVNSGASLDLVGAITDGGTIDVVSGATLMLSGAVVDGDDGNSINVFGGNIEVSASSILDGGLVVNGFSGGLTVDNGATLTADDITLQSVGVTNNGTLQIDSDHTLKLSGTTTIDGGTIVDNGTIEISGSVTISDAVLEGTGQFIVDSGATLYLEDDGDTFDGVSITNHGGNIQVDGPTPQTVLTLEGGATISGGTLSIGSKGAVDIATGASGPDATLTSVTVDNSGQIDVQGTLTLAGGTISGGTIDLALGMASPQPIEIAVPGFYAIGPEVSANGQFVAFIASTSLPGQGGGDTNGLIELYSVAAGGQPTPISLLVPQADLHDSEVFGDLPSLSDNGHLVVFEGKYSDNFGPTSEVFLYNSQAAPGSQITVVRTDAGQAAISGNGTVIAAEGNTSGTGGNHILLMNDAGVVQTEITGDPSYVPPNNNSDNFGNVGSVYNPSLSDDGRYVAFWSASSEIAVVGGPTFATGNATGAAEVYIYDTLTHTLKEASGVLGSQGNGDSGTLSLNDEGSSWAPSLSGNGRFVVFQSTANNLVSGVGDANNDVSNIFLYDSRTGTITAVTDANGSSVTGDSIRPTVSADGKSITFSSDDSDLPGAGGGSANGGWQTYMVSIDPATGALSAPELLSAGFPGADNGQNNLASGVSDGGGVTAFGGAVLAFNSQQRQATISSGTITFSDLSLSDFDSGGDTLTLTISVAHGTLVTAGSSGAGQQTLTITGTLAQIDAALQTGVTYMPGSPPSASDTLSLQVTDQASGAAASFVSTFNPTATDPSQLFSGSPATTGQYDIFLSEQQTINVTADATIDSGAQIEGGLIVLASGVTLTLADITDTDTSIHDFTSTVAFTGSSTLEGTGIFGGTNQSGQPAGHVTVGSGVTLILDDVVFKNVAVTVDSDGTTPSFQIDAGHTFSWAGASSFGGPGSVIIDNNGHIIHDGTLDIGFTQVTFEGTGTVTQDGGNHGTEAQTLINEGNTIDGYGTYGSLATIDNESGSFDADVAGRALVFNTGNTITNADTFEATNGGILTIESNTTLDNTGTVVADGGTVKLLGVVTGAGSEFIEHGGTLEIGNVDAQSVTFEGAGTLQLDPLAVMGGPVDGVAAGDTFDLTGFGAGAHDQFQLSTTYDPNSNTTTLTVTDTSLDGAPSSAPFAISGNYANPNEWVATYDAHGGIDVTALPAVGFDPTYLSFGSDNQAASGAPPSTQTDNVTIAGWINWNGGNASGSQEVLFYNGTTDKTGYGLIVAPTADGRLDVQGLAGGQTVLDGNTTLSANQWYFVALARVDGTFHLYIDGVEQTGLTNAGTAVTAIGADGQMQIGGPGHFDDPEIFSGSIADVSVWDTALVQSQIQAIQDTLLSGTESGLAGYYPLSDGSGTTAADTVNSTGNLTLSGNPAWVVDGSNSWPVASGDVPENTSATLVGINVSHANPDDTITVTLGVSHGALTLGSTAGLSSETGLGTGAVTLAGTEAEIDAALASGLSYTPTAGFVGGDALTVVASDGGVASSPESLAINVIGAADFWGQEEFPAVVQGEHLFGVNPQFNSLAGIVALAYDDMSDYSTSDTSLTLTTNIESLDPFFLPRPHSAQTGSSFTVEAPGRYGLIVPNIDYSASNSPDGVAGPSSIGIYVFKGEADSVNGIWQVLAIPDSNGSGGVTLGNPTEVGTTPTTDETIFNLKETFHNSSGFASSYAFAWDQFSGNSATTGAYSVELQLVGINSSAGSFAGVFNPTTVLTVSLASDVAETALPAWDFKSGDGNYVLATAESSGGTDNVVHFENYKINDTGTGIATGSFAFTIQPNLSAYELGATNEIVQPVVATLSPYPGQVAEALQFVQSPDNGNDYFVVWNETVADSQGTHDQVEFAVANSAGTELSLPSSISTFQTDGRPQNVRVGEFTDPVNSSRDDVVVVYGDDTGTHILEYAVTSGGGTVSLIADFTDPTTQAFDNLTVMGDGRIAITYDDPVNALPDETSQYDFKIFDLRTAGLNIDDSSLNDGLKKYIAGTHFSDSFTGETNVNNEYYFVGQDGASGTTPADTFHGGSGGWNIAIFADARSDYTISTQIESSGPNITTIASNGDDPAHTGSLAVTNVEFLAFDPAGDPTPQNNIIDVNGGTFVILGGNSAVTIEAGATAEIDSAASGQTSYAGNISFAGLTGILQVDQLNELTGQISGITHGDPGQVLDLDGFGAQSADHFSVSAVLDGNGDTMLTVTDIDAGGQPAESVTLAGNYTDDTWAATNDGHGGVNVADPPATDLSGNGSVGFLPNDEQITFGQNGEVTYTLDSGTTAGTTTQNQTTFVANGGAVVGGPGNDNFVFQPGMGAGTITNFNPQQDTLTFDHFAEAQTTQELQSLITTDAHGDAMINLGHNDSVTLSGVTTAQLQQAIQSSHVLLH